MVKKSDHMIKPDLQRTKPLLRSLRGLSLNLFLAHFCESITEDISIVRPYQGRSTVLPDRHAVRLMQCYHAITNLMKLLSCNVVMCLLVCLRDVSSNISEVKYSQTNHIIVE